MLHHFRNDVALGLTIRSAQEVAEQLVHECSTLEERVIASLNDDVAEAATASARPSDQSF